VAFLWRGVNLEADLSSTLSVAVRPDDDRPMICLGDEDFSVVWSLPGLAAEADVVVTGDPNHTGMSEACRRMDFDDGPLPSSKRPYSPGERWRSDCCSTRRSDRARASVSAASIPSQTRRQIIGRPASTSKKASAAIPYFASIEGPTPFMIASTPCQRARRTQSRGGADIAPEEAYS